MENKIKNSNWGLIVTIILVLLLIGGGIFYFTRNKKVDTPTIEDTTIVKKYTAYIKINPSVKLEYSQTCNRLDTSIYDCAEPVVESYDLINEDAETIFEDINLFEKGKTLDKVLEVIVDKVEESNIEFKTVEITSDWTEINTYIEKTKSTKNPLIIIQ